MATYLASDVHWQPARLDDGPDPTGAFGRFLIELASRATAGEPCNLYVLGDLFDFWWERGDATLPCFDAHVDALGQAASAGVQITLLWGNRDFTLRGALPRRTGVEVAGDRVELELGHRRTVLQHGDLLCTNDRRYQLFRRLIRSLPVRGLMRLIPRNRVDALVARMRQASRAEIERKASASMQVTETAVAVEAARGFDLIICGHVHQPERRQVGGAELVTLGPWSRHDGWFVRSDTNGIELLPFP